MYRPNQTINLVARVDEVYWIYAEGKKGEYPKPTARSGKWLIFFEREKVDDVWFKIKKAV